MLEHIFSIIEKSFLVNKLEKTIVYARACNDVETMHLKYVYVRGNFMIKLFIAVKLYSLFKY